MKFFYSFFGNNKLSQSIFHCKDCRALQSSYMLNARNLTKL